MSAELFYTYNGQDTCGNPVPRQAFNELQHIYTKGPYNWGDEDTPDAFAYSRQESAQADDSATMSYTPNVDEVYDWEQEDTASRITAGKNAPVIHRTAMPPVLLDAEVDERIEGLESQFSHDSIHHVLPVPSAEVLAELQECFERERAESRKRATALFVETIVAAAAQRGDDSLHVVIDSNNTDSEP